MEATKTINPASMGAYYSLEAKSAQPVGMLDTQVKYLIDSILYCEHTLSTLESCLSFSGAADDKENVPIFETLEDVLAYSCTLIQKLNKRMDILLSRLQEQIGNTKILR